MNSFSIHKDPSELGYQPKLHDPVYHHESNEEFSNHIVDRDKKTDTGEEDDVHVSVEQSNPLPYPEPWIPDRFNFLYASG